MKVLSLFMAVMAFSQVVSSMNLRSPEWDTFKVHYLKSYGTVAEEKSKIRTYMENKKMIAEHNAKYEKGLVSYKLALNEFADFSPEEFVSVYARFRLSGASANLLFTNSNVSTSLKAPGAIDWRQKGAVTGVKNQAQCGSCWAFSAIGAREGQHFRKHGVLVPLSEQNLVDCSGKYGNQGCNGGWMTSAFQYIKDNKGVNTEKSYPYQARQTQCRFDRRNIGATLTGYKDIPSGDEESLKAAVGNVGPVAVAIDSNPKSFQFYSKGVYNEPACTQTKLSHAVLAVGYGTDQHGGDYWLVKNSWGPGWGEGGYIKMARNRNNQCGIATKASYPLV